MEGRVSEEARKRLDMLNDMISLSAERLHGLRTQCSTTAEITQQEIRSLEGKLIKLFSNQLLVKKGIPSECLPHSDDDHVIPSLRLWLQVVGITNDRIKEICSRVDSLESLKVCSQHKIRTLLSECHANDEEIRKLTKALHHLTRYTDEIGGEVLLDGGSLSGSLSDVTDLFWDSWDMDRVGGGGGGTGDCSTAPCTPITTLPFSSVNSPFSFSSLIGYSPTNSSVFYPSSPSNSTFTPPMTPPTKTRYDYKKNAETPPARKKHSAWSQIRNLPQQQQKNQSNNSPLTKCKSHESRLANRIEWGSEPDVTRTTTGDQQGGPQTPKSPRTPTLARSMGHVISHRFTKMWKVCTCDYCGKQVIVGLNCKDCKYKCHRDCERKVPPSCGLPSGLLDAFVQSVKEADSQKTSPLPVRSDSQISDRELNDRNRDRNRFSWTSQNSFSHREWDIPFDELLIGEKIGTGHFGTVYRGNWHGAVAIRVLDMTGPDNLDKWKALEQFKEEVRIFRKTRHENLELFMGACVKPPRLAIVTSLCQGQSLYEHLHFQKDKFNMSKKVRVAQEIAQGMSYLHARGIIHKDLTSRNVFLESGKVVITDFGLFSVTKLCCIGRIKNSLHIPPDWLSYLAPEIMRTLQVTQENEDSELPFSKASDIYSFGMVWYELLCGEMPWKGLPPESIIWQVGSGIRQPLLPFFSRDAQDILLMCWSSKPEDRFDFGRILMTLEKLSKIRLSRSTSLPIIPPICLDHLCNNSILLKTTSS